MAENLADKRQVRVIVTTDDVDRSGEIVVPDGVDWSKYMATGAGPVLFNHDPNQPVASCISIERTGNGIVALVQFPPEGQLPLSDNVYKMITNGLVNAASIGFMPVETMPLDKGNPSRGPQRYMKSDMMEFSFTPTPCNGNAVITGKSMKNGTKLKVGASRELKIADAEVDTRYSAAEMFDRAGFHGESPDTTAARKGFLVYDASNPESIDAYGIPFAVVTENGLAVTRGSLAAARKALDGTELAADIREKAVAVLDSYEARFAAEKKAKAAPKMTPKGLWQVAQLAYMLDDLAWLEECVEWEAEIEQDGSNLPDILADIMRQMGAALIAMTQEEVAELLGEEAMEAGGMHLADGGMPADADEGVEMVANMAPIMNILAKNTEKLTIKSVFGALKALKTAESSDTDVSEPADTVKANDERAKRLREVEIMKLKMGF